MLRKVIVWGGGLQKKIIGRNKIVSEPMNFLGGALEKL